MTIKTIVALLDLTKGTQSVLDYAKSMATAFRSNLVLLHVSPPQIVSSGIGTASFPYFSEPSTERREGDWAQLCEIRDSLVGSAIQVATDQVMRIEPDQVLSECHRLRADLIVMGSTHRGILDEQGKPGVRQHDTYPALVVPVEDHSTLELRDLQRGLPEVGEAPNPFAVA